jgi:hypothetical protein
MSVLSHSCDAVIGIAVQICDEHRYLRLKIPANQPILRGVRV